jgi:NADPH:quinone reductase-like Zn-dependent oxidoreductase
LRDCFDVLKPGAKTVCIAGVPEPKMVREDVGLGPLWAAGAWALSTKIRRLARRKGVSYRLMLMHSSGDDLNVLAGFVDEGHLKPVIDRVLPFQQIPRCSRPRRAGSRQG